MTLLLPFKGRLDQILMFQHPGSLDSDAARRSVLYSGGEEVLLV